MKLLNPSVINAIDSSQIVNKHQGMNLKSILNNPMGSWSISKAVLKSLLSARNHQAVALTWYLQKSKTKAVAPTCLIHNIKTKAVALTCLLKISRIKAVVLICFVKKSKTKVVALTCLIQNILTKKMLENHQKEVISTVTRIQSFNDLACDQFTYIYYLTFCINV
jgi:hypothetical protein